MRNFIANTRILDSLKCLQMSQVLKKSLAKNAKDAKVFLGGLCVFAREKNFSCLVSLRLGLAGRRMSVSLRTASVAIDAVRTSPHPTNIKRTINHGTHGLHGIIPVFFFRVFGVFRG